MATPAAAPQKAIVTPYDTPPSVPPDVVRFVCLSDTHSGTVPFKVPDGDVLIHAGDFTMVGFLEEAEVFNDWLGHLPHKHKMVVCGNHEKVFDPALVTNPANPWQVLSNATYLQDQQTSVYGLRVYGAPWTPIYGTCAFSVMCGSACKKKWSAVPKDTDILVTHGPPRGQGDLTRHGKHVGCKELRDVVKAVKPKCHVFGHIHEGYGITNNEDTVFINASMCNRGYRLTNPPIVFDMPLPPGHTKDNTPTSQLGYPYM